MGRVTSVQIMVVDDNVDLAENVAELLEDVGDSVDTRFSRGARGAMDIAEHSGFDVAIVDLRLSEGDDGLALLPRLREACPAGEVILMTGHATLDTAVSAVRQGAFAYVLKPFDPVDLLSLVSRAVEQVQLRQERARLAAELEVSEALHRAIVENSQALLVGVDANGVVEFASPYATRMVGELVGAPFAASFAHTDPQPLQDTLAAALVGTSSQDVLAELLDTNEEPRVVRWTVSPVKQHAGVSALAVGIDVTDELKADRAARRAEAMAAMGRLTAGLAHEIRNPLNGALLQLELLKRATRRAPDEVAEDLRGTAAIIERELRGLSDLLDDFLTMARGHDQEGHAFDLLQVAREVVELQGPVAAQGDVSIELDVGPRAVALGQRGHVRRALLNLVRNAIEAQPDGGAVCLRIHEQDAELVVEVCDSGPGFTEEMLNQALMPFKTDKPGGTGLGLSIVERVVNTHGGSLALYNQESGGGLVRLSLPSVSSDAQTSDLFRKGR